MAPQCSELWSLERAYTLGPCKFKLKRIIAAAHYNLCSKPCQSVLCNRAHNKVHFTACTARCLCAPLPWTAHSMHWESLGVLIPMIVFTLPFYQAALSEITRAEFHSNHAHLFLRAHSVKRPSKGCVRERNAWIHPHPIGLHAFLTGASEVKAIVSQFQQFVILFKQHFSAINISHLKEHRWPSSQPSRPGNPQTHSQF